MQQKLKQNLGTRLLTRLLTKLSPGARVHLLLLAVHVAQAGPPHWVRVHLQSVHACVGRRRGRRRREKVRNRGQGSRRGWCLM